jgi:predicted dithiol-disulfide oxidoreductase (DUF899 family)
VASKAQRVLKEEKELTHRSNELARKRRELPWLPIDNEYRFETERGAPRFKISSEGARSFSSATSCSAPTTRPDARRAQRSQTASTGFVIHLENHGVAFTAVSRAPLEKLQAYKRRMGSSFPWASSFGSDFNYDFNTSVTEEQQRVGMVEYNFRTNDARYRQEAVTEGPRAEFAAGAGTDC